MRRLVGICAALAVAVASGAASAQTHVVKKPETVVRAIGVFEWTGDESKPTASRLVPVSVFIDNQLEDAGIYMARPVPFALYTGTIFEVQKSGIPEGTVQLAYERHLEGNSVTQFDDGWLGYGLFKPASQAPVYTARKSGPLPQVVASGGNRPKLGNKTDSGTTTASADDSSRPTMRRRTDSGSSDDSGATTSTNTPPASTTSADSSRPTMRRRTDSDSTDTTASADSTPAKPATTTAKTTESDDPDRPVLKRRSDSSDTPDATADETAATPAATTSTADTTKTASSDDSNRPTMRRRTSDSTDSSSTTSDTSDDADRPTLKKRTPTPQGKSQKRQGDTASVSSVGGSLNDDPDRPTLHRGAAAGGADTNGIPPLNGLPADMHQRVAVSDAKDRPEHDFARPWDSDSERADVLAKMQDFARARLAKYDVAAPAPPSVPAPPAPKTVAKGKKPVVVPPPPPAPVELTDESLRAYTLSYGGSATFVYSASSPGVGGATRYVSIVAQREPMSELKVALASVTDTTHLDRTPWMRLIDVVDAEASNRASLLFELRGQSARQFALYRVIGSTAEQIFQTGTTE